MTVTITNKQFEQIREMKEDYNKCKKKLEAIQNIIIHNFEPEGIIELIAEVLDK